MPRSKISEYSATANSNTDVAGVNVDEGCAPSGINNAIRAVMGHLKDFQTGAVSDPLTVGGAFTTSSTVTHNGGTANGVAYLNGSKVLTTGSALVFDGTNLGLGVTPSAWSGGYKSLDITSGASFFGYPTSYAGVATNAVNNSGWKYRNTAAAALYQQEINSHVWYTAASGTAGNAITFTQAMTLDADGDLGIGTTSPAQKLHISANEPKLRITSTAGSGKSWELSSGGGTTVNAGQFCVYDTTTDAQRFNIVSGTGNMTLDASGNLIVGATATRGTYKLDVRSDTSIAIGSNATYFGTIGYSAGVGLMSLAAESGGGINFLSGSTERARIDSSGNLLVGTTSGSYHIIQKTSASSAGAQVISIQGGSGFAIGFEVYEGANSGAPNAANSTTKIGQMNVTGRSINTAGTVNASGADYAEYMTKAGNFTVAKGDVVGVDAQGKLTNVFATAVTFVVKSTDPSYVGGDTWGAGFNDDAEGLEAARQTVDRIAFAGQVPVNVTGATAGQYIIPVNDNGAIKGVAVSNPTFEQYQQAVGKVIAIEQDGRARIIVKVA